MQEKQNLFISKFITISFRRERRRRRRREKKEVIFEKCIILNNSLFSIFIRLKPSVPISVLVIIC